MAVVVIVSIEEALLLTSIGIHVGVVTIKDDMAGYSSVVGQDEHSHEHLLYAEKVVVRNHILEAAHVGGRTQLSVQVILLDATTKDLHRMKGSLHRHWPQF